MEERIRKMWFEEIKERLNIQSVATCILYGGDTETKEDTLSEREEKAEMELMRSLKRLECVDKDVLEAFDGYEEVIKEVYFEMGVRIGVCLEAELVLKEEGSR